MTINGLLVDCSRVLERKGYYFRLIDFMADWEMNTLVLHFSDDHGFSIRLRGFEELACPNAFTPAEIRKLIAHASEKGIEVIPELETFGHTRYLTHHPRYAHLNANKQSRKLNFGAIDPLAKESFLLMEKMIKALCKIFSGKYFHIGCDEVDLTGYCKLRPGLDPDEVWTGYVNRMIALVRKEGREPMLWGDHPARNAYVAEHISKDATVCWWDYELKPSQKELKNLAALGFNGLLACPAVACYLDRFHPNAGRLENITKSVRLAYQQGCGGVINTQWVPFRYLQGSMYYGIAFGAALVGSKGQMTKQYFHSKFVEQVFGQKLTPQIAKFLNNWTRLDLGIEIYKQVADRKISLSKEQMEQVELVNKQGLDILPLIEDFEPAQNQDIWSEMKVAASCSWICSESIILSNKARVSKARKTYYNDLLRTLRRQCSDIWDKTRYADDIYKTKAKFQNEQHQYASYLLKRLTLQK